MFSHVERNIDYELLFCEDSSRVKSILQKQQFVLQDYYLLLSPAAKEFLPEMAQRAAILTRNYFGKTMQLYVPLYLSNVCCNGCVYCGFNINSKVERVTLSLEEIEKELEVLRVKGFRNVLLLTGEDKSAVPADYIVQAIKLAKKFFDYVSLEIYPTSVAEYQQFVAAGASGLTVYQETYHQETYSEVHPTGPKSNYTFRLDTPDRALSGGIRKVGLGTLLGLHDWRQEMATIGFHLDYLMKKYWQAEFSVSFPRMRNEGVGYRCKYEVSDKNLVQMILAARLFQPSVGLIISTRESAEFRDKLLDIGITQISAESRTNPGGYSGKESLKQFAIADERSLAEVKEVLVKKGYDPVAKDWSKVF